MSTKGSGSTGSMREMIRPWRQFAGTEPGRIHPCYFLTRRRARRRVAGSDQACEVLGEAHFQRRSEVQRPVAPGERIEPIATTLAVEVDTCWGAS